MSVAEIFCKISDKLFGDYSDKVKIIANVLLHDWRMLPPAAINHDIGNITDSEIQNNFADVDEISRNHIQRYVKGQRSLPTANDYLDRYFYNYAKWLTDEELKSRSAELKQLTARRKEYAINAASESLLAHHGLVNLSAKVLAHIYHTTFIDAGAFNGDSSLIFAKFYQPEKIIAVEPSRINREKYCENLRRNHISGDLYELWDFGLGKEMAEMPFCDNGDAGSRFSSVNTENTILKVKSLDSVSTDIGRIGLLKADLEGMGWEMLMGAEKTIREHRPLLSLAVYHNKNELINIYNTLRKWDLNYKIMFRLLALPLFLNELTLIAYPKEWE